MATNCIILFSAAAFFFFFHGVSSALTSNISDQSALLALKSHISFNSSNVFLEKNWSASSSVCSWMGITCSSRHNRVVSLDISNLGLAGIIPPDLGNLSFLSSLDISNNSFNGSLPEELAHLRRLKFLGLSRNRFSGPIPSFISSLGNLQFLFCSHNGLSGSIPSSLSNLSKLEELTLNFNLLEGSIPWEMGDLHSLAILQINHNQLRGPLPASIFNLSKLQVMDFTNNLKISGNLPADICEKLPKLEVLHLSSNELEGVIPPGLGKCLRLRSLSLLGNNFIGSIPREIGNLTLLEILYLGNNYLEGSIPSEIGDLQSLQVLGLARGLLNGSIPETIFNISTLQVFTCWENILSGNLPSNMGQGLQNLEEIYLGRNILTGIIPEPISNASKLRLLDFVSNSFSGPIPKSLGNLRFLQILFLGQNNLTIESSSSELQFLTSLTKCRDLSQIVISENPFNGFLPSSIGNFSSSLQLFVADRCKIRGNVPQEIGNLSGIARLFLSDNDLTGFIPTTIEDLQSLQELYLGNNNIKGSIPNVICDLPNLGVIELQGNQISGTVPSCIGNLTSLRNLNLASNNLSSSLPPSLWRLRSLLQFDASSNSLSGHLPLEIENLIALTVMNLSNNFFSGNVPSSIAGLQNLVNLSLAQNELEGPIPDSFGKLISLEALDLSQNKLTGEIPQSLEVLDYLRIFNVSFNQLSGQIPNKGPFQNFTHESFESNGALCGAPRFQVKPCSIVSHKRIGKRSKRTLLVACSLVGISSLFLASTLCFVLIRWRKKKKDNLETVVSPAVTHERTSYHELERATNGFDESNLLGIGSYSSVYKGILNDGTIVAVKVFNLKLSAAEKSFNTECEVMRSIRHRNLTKVITSCSNLHQDFKALVLEYMPNGSLEKWLYSHNHFLDTFQRLDIMIDVASALDYLHSGQVTPVVHCDVKPRNVLLDENMAGHVCDFGISKLLAAENGTAQTKTIATIGYIAPEYGLDGIVSTKCDVYSYGIMLMETFTRTKPSDDMFSGDVTLREWIRDSLPNGIMKVADSNLLNPEEANLDAKVKCVSSVMELALECTTASPEARKEMQDVLSSLNKLRAEFLAGCRIS